MKRGPHSVLKSYIGEVNAARGIEIVSKVSTKVVAGPQPAFTSFYIKITSVIVGIPFFPRQ